MNNAYEIRGDITAILIKRKNGDMYESLIDTDDLPKLLNAGGSWCIDLPYNHKDPARKPYAIRNAPKEGGGREYVKLHRFLVDAPYGKVVDHINGKTLDNRKTNLRITDLYGNAQNIQEPSRNNKCGELNVHYNRFEDVWIATVMRDGVLQRAKRKSFDEAVKCAQQMREGTYEPLGVGRRAC